MSEYVKDFVIGSSWPVFVLYFYAVVSIPDNVKNYSYVNYTFMAPVVLGIFNVLGGIVARKFNLDRMSRFVLTGLVSAIGVYFYAVLVKAYNFSNMSEWLSYFIVLLLLYMVVFSIIVHGLDSILST